MKREIKKILLVTGELEVHGSTIYTLNLAKGLRQSGVEAVVLCGGGKMEHLFRKIPARLIIEKSLAAGLHPFFSFRKMLDKLVMEQFQLVHIQESRYIKNGIKVARRLSVPAVATVHRVFGKGNRLYTPPQLAGIIAVSQVVRESIVNRAAVDRELVRVIVSGIDTERAAALIRRPDPKTAPVIGAVGRLTKEAGIAYFIQAAEVVHSRFPQAQFLIAGKGSESRKLRRLVQQLGLTKCVTFIEEIRENLNIITAIDIFIAPSITEGLGQTILEAMACAKPAIATTVGGIHSFLEDGETGLLVPPREPDTLAAATCRILEDSELAARMSSRAQQLVHREFTLQKMVKESIDYYERIISA